MIELQQEIIKKLKKQIENEISNAVLYSFKNEKDITEKIPIINNGIIYLILSNGILKYIGKSKGKYFRQRMKSHFFDKGKGTSSKFKFIDSERKKGNSITLKYLEIKPEALRNLIEELLIEKYKETNIWNYKNYTQQCL